MSAPIYHSYHHETGEYLGPVTASLDPLETKLAGQTIYMRPPAHAAADAPIGAAE